MCAIKQTSQIITETLASLIQFFSCSWRSHSLKYTSKMFVVLAAGIVLALVGGIVSFWAFSLIQGTASMRAQVYANISEGNRFLSAFSDTETGQRGFLLTNDEAFLEPYTAVFDRMGDSLERLRQRSLPGEARLHLDVLGPLVADKLADMAHVIDLYRNSDQSETMARMLSGDGKRLMDSIRAEMGHFILLKEAEAAQLDASFDSSMRFLFVMIVACSLLAFLFAVIVTYFTYQSVRQRLSHSLYLERQHLLEVQQQTNEQLRQANVTLQEEEQKLAVTLNSIGDGVIATDANACVTRLNPVAEKLTGWLALQALGRPIDEVFQIISQETRERAEIPVMETLAHGTVQGLANHTVLIARDGSEHAIADSCAPIRNAEGQVTGAVLVFRDVTEEYASQQALHDSAAQIHAILNTVVDGIMTVRVSTGLIETVNLAAERMFGYEAAELIGQQSSLLIPEIDDDQKNGLLTHDIASHEAFGSSLGREIMGRRKDGSMFPLEMSISEMWLGGQRYFTEILRDNSARKDAEAALRESGALQNAIFNSANFSSIATDANGVIQIFNLGAQSMLGYTAAEVVNKITPADISDPLEVVQRAVALSAERGTNIEPGFEALVYKASRGIEDIYELTYIRKNGSRFSAVVSVTALRDARHAIIGYLLIGTDNTARKRIEAKQEELDQLLRDQQFYTRSLIEANTDALMTTDLSGIIIDLNRQTELLTGFPRDALIGTSFKNYFTDPERAQAASDQVLSGKQVTNYELTARARNGQETVVSYNAATLYDRHSKRQGVFAAARDITEPKRLEQALQDKNAELESAKSVAEKANLAKSDFLSSMSHELRTPLNAILGFAQLLETGTPVPTPAQKRNLEQILKAGWYLLDLINEILDLALIESGRVMLSGEPVSLVDVMLECQAMIEPQAQKRGISMMFQHFDSACFVKADHTRLKQVLINILFNAVKYNKPEGSVSVEHTFITPDSIRISIRDTGLGFAPEQLTQLYQPFNRLGREAGKEEGTGIGLVVTKRLVEMMGGVIGVDSTVGAGSVFWIELSLIPAPSVLAHESDQDAVMRAIVPAGMPLRTVLYVEDNPANLELVEQLLARRADLQLISASDGNLGIEFARTYMPDLILMDIHLPGISGLEAMKILRADPATAHIPIIALSANAVPRDVLRGIEAGFFNYLTKPIQVALFMNALDAALLPGQDKNSLVPKEE